MREQRLWLAGVNESQDIRWSTRRSVRMRLTVLSSGALLGVFHSQILVLKPTISQNDWAWNGARRRTD